MKIICRVKAGASKNEIIKIGESEFKISVTVRPDKGLANKAAINLLSKHFHVPKSNISIISGHTSPFKVISLGLKD